MLTKLLLLTLLGVVNAQDFITRGSNTGTHTKSPPTPRITPFLCRPRMGTHHQRCPARNGGGDQGMDELGGRCWLPNHTRPQHGALIQHAYWQHVILYTSLHSSGHARIC